MSDILYALNQYTSDLRIPPFGDSVNRRLAMATKAITSATAIENALLAVVAATRAYLPPDGISQDECLNRILMATDNPEISTIILEIENARS